MKNILLLLLSFFALFTGAQNSVMTFDGVDDYIDIGKDVATGTRTIEIWFKPAKEINSTLTNFSSLVVREISIVTNANEFNIAFVKPSASGATGSIQFVVRDSNNLRYAVNSDTTVWNADQWYHLAAVIDPVKGMMLFIDGKKQSDTNAYSSAIVFNSNYTAVGRWGKYTNGRYFEGSIDDVHFSSKALYTSDFIPPCPDIKASANTLGLWNFNDTSNTIIAIDSSGNSYDGDIYGAKGEVDNICEPDTGNFDTTSNCKAFFTIEKDSSSQYNVILYNKSTNKSSHSYLWDFGDGNTKTGRTPIHTYQNFGLYEVCLTIADSILGCDTTVYCDTVGMDSLGNLKAGFGIEVRDAIATGIEEKEEISSDINVYPNPSNGEFTFVFSSQVVNRNAELSVYSYTGKLVAFQTINIKETVDLSGLSKGVYFYNVSLANKVYTGKLIKQ